MNHQILRLVKVLNRRFEDLDMSMDHEEDIEINIDENEMDFDDELKM